MEYLSTSKVPHKWNSMKKHVITAYVQYGVMNRPETDQSDIRQKSSTKVDSGWQNVLPDITFNESVYSNLKKK